MIMTIINIKIIIMIKKQYNTINDSAPEVDPDAPDVDRNSVKRTQLRRELDEVSVQIIF